MDIDASLVIDDDDDDVVIMLDSTENIHNDAKSTTDVIDLEESDEKTGSKHNELNKEASTDQETLSNNHKTKLNGDEEDFAKLLKSNTLMNKIIMKCLSMDNNKGIQLIINKTLLPIYRNVDSKFKKSDYFLKVLNKVMTNLKRDPQHKFSHIKTLCVELKKKEHRKKVPFVTVTTDIKTARKKHSAVQKITKRKDEYSKENRSAVIDLDNSDEDKVIHLVDDDETDDDVIIVDEINKEKTVQQFNKENCYIANNITNFESLKDDNILIPEKSVEVKHYKIDLEKAKAVVEQIVFYKSMLNKLEEQEVTVDSSFSPYVQCDKIKTKIVELYKILCKLSGYGDVEILKQRCIRLQAIDGHPTGPIKRLEKFLNSTIDETGGIPLPDFHDVVRCVTQSNIVDRLGWDKQQITNEAVALFTHCGHALRESRQKREYKDLLSLMREKAIDDNDPANEDPQLLARLEENELIAKANEREIFDRYANMEAMSKLPYLVKPGKRKILRIRSADSDSDSENENDKQRKRMRNIVTPNINQISNKTIPNINQNQSQHSEHVTNSFQAETDTSFASTLTENTFNSFINYTAASCLGQNYIVSTEQQPLHNQTSTSVNFLHNDNAKSLPMLKILPITSNAYSSYQSFIRDKNFNKTNEVNRKTNNTQEIKNKCNNSCGGNDKNTQKQNTSQNRNLVEITIDGPIYTQDIINETYVEIPKSSNFKVDETIITQKPMEKQYNNLNETKELSERPENNAHEETTIKEEPIDIEHNKIITQVTENKENFIYTSQKCNKHVELNKMQHNTKEIQTESNTTQNSNVDIEEIIVEQESADAVQKDCESFPNGNILRKMLRSSNDNNGVTVIKEKQIDIQHNISDIQQNGNVIETRILPLDLQNRTSLTETQYSSSENNANSSQNVAIKLEKPVIKHETIDINRLLNNLGDNYISTIFDIEDPFLVIDILSDSTSEDEL